jgi:hypothetical protein
MWRRGELVTDRTGVVDSTAETRQDRRWIRGELL